MKAHRKNIIFIFESFLTLKIWVGLLNGTHMLIFMIPYLFIIIQVIKGHLRTLLGYEMRALNFVALTIVLTLKVCLGTYLKVLQCYDEN